MLDIPGEDQIAAGVPRLTIQARHVHRLGHGNGLLTLDGREHYRFEEASARHRMEGAFTEIRLLCGTGRLWCSIRLEIEGHKQTLEIMRSDASVFQKP